MNGSEKMDKRLRGVVCNLLIVSALHTTIQKDAFYTPKGRVLRADLRPFAARNAAFCKALKSGSTAMQPLQSRRKDVRAC